MFWFASAIAPLCVSILLLEDRYATCFGIAMVCWVVYFLYVIFIIKETRIPGDKHTQSSIDEAVPQRQGFRKVLVQSLVDPLAFIFKDTTLRWLGLATVTMLVALGAFSVLVVYCDYMFGMRASEVR